MAGRALGVENRRDVLREGGRGLLGDGGGQRDRRSSEQRGHSESNLHETSLTGWRDAFEFIIPGMSDVIREAGLKFRNWGVWGPDDELGTLNFVTPAMIVKAAGLIRRGAVFSLAIPF